MLCHAHGSGQALYCAVQVQTAQANFARCQCCCSCETSYLLLHSVQPMLIYICTDTTDVRPLQAAHLCLHLSKLSLNFGKLPLVVVLLGNQVVANGYYVLHVSIGDRVGKAESSSLQCSRPVEQACALSTGSTA